MNTLDIILAVLLIFGLVKGYFNGFILEVASLASLILGIYISMYFSHFVASLISNWVDLDSAVTQIIAFGGTFLAVVIGVNLAGKLFTKLAESISLGVLNKILGAVFGLLKIALIVSIVLIVFDGLNKNDRFVEKAKLEESVLYEPVKGFGEYLFPKLIKVKESIKIK